MILEKFILLLPALNLSRSLAVILLALNLLLVFPSDTYMRIFLTPVSIFKRLYRILCFILVFATLPILTLNVFPTTWVCFILWLMSYSFRSLRFFQGIVRSPVNIEEGELCNNSKRLLAVNYCCKAGHLRCLRGSWLRP